MIKVMVVDDSALMRKLLGQIFASASDIEVQFARNGSEALEQLKVAVPDAITLDIHMPVMDGLTCLDRIMIEHPCPVVMVSSLTAEGAEATLEALRLGAVDFVAKPDGPVSLSIDILAGELLSKVRAAASSKLRRSVRLKERVRHKIGLGSVRPKRPSEAGPLKAVPEAAVGDGLVVIGTSTGGPSALEAVLVPLPGTFPWPIVIAQHMPATFTGALSRRLDTICSISVIEVTNPTELLPGCAYVARGDGDMIISRRAGVLFALPSPAKADYPWHPSADRLMRSAMEQVAASQLIGVLLTGMGNDGAEAMSRLHDEGGRTIAEAEETAVVWGMPGELAAANGADWVLPLARIAEYLQKLVPPHAAHS